MKDLNNEISRLEEESSLAYNNLTGCIYGPDYDEQFQRWQKIVDEKTKLEKERDEAINKKIEVGTKVGEVVLTTIVTAGLGYAGLKMTQYLFNTGMKYESEGNVFHYQTFKDFLKHPKM